MSQWSSWRFAGLLSAVLIVAVTGCGPVTPPEESDSSLLVVNLDLEQVCHQSIGEDTAVTGSVPIIHPAWGPTRIITCGPGVDAPTQRQGVVALDQVGAVRWVGGEESFAPPSYRFELAEPATDETGNIFIVYNPGRYDSVAILRPTSSGMEVLAGGYGDDAAPLNFYYASLVGPGVDGRYQIEQYNNDCDPTCAGGAKSSQLYQWNGQTYVEVAGASPSPSKSPSPSATCPKGIKLPVDVDPALVCATKVTSTVVLKSFKLPKFDSSFVADGFQSPTGNLACSWHTMGTVVCKAAVMSVPYPYDPETEDASHEINCQRGLTISDNHAGLACAGDVEPIDFMPGASTVPVLAYGQTVLSTDYAFPWPWDDDNKDPVACHSAEDGITCWNVNTQHGIKIARNIAVFW